MTIEQARKVIGSKDWPKIKAQLKAGGEFTPYPEAEVARWLEALEHAADWRTVVDGAKVRELKAQYPGIYPEVLRLLPYFNGKPDLRKQLLKMKFPEAYETCYC